jgi:hypothetical protein
MFSNLKLLKKLDADIHGGILMLSPCMFYCHIPKNFGRCAWRIFSGALEA